jgi:hypothetical protein
VQIKKCEGIEIDTVPLVHKQLYSGFMVQDHLRLPTVFALRLSTQLDQIQSIEEAVGITFESSQSP